MCRRDLIGRTNLILGDMTRRQQLPAIAASIARWIYGTFILNRPIFKSRTRTLERLATGTAIKICFGPAF